ncbi:MAG: MmgE/PrpD family protein [Candidatus Rokubacteria bacterium]|nr:MmgE/PrpD family protein [Candidatus Rokubacteria bacterium]
MNITARLARFIADTRFDDLPAGVVHEAKRSFLDFLATALAGADHPAVGATLALIAHWGGTPEATVVGRHKRAPAPLAALANGLMAHVLDYDDTHMPSMLHAASVVVPAVAGAGEPRRIDGRSALLACALGYEVGVRIGNAITGSHARRGWHTTGTVGTLAAAVAAGKVVGLDAGGLARALALAATQASGLIAVFGTMGKSLNVGKAAMNGVLAADLARAGFTAPLDAVESERGFVRVFTDETSMEELTTELGVRWESARIGRKPYPCGLVIHPVIDGALEIRRMLHGQVSGIEHVAVRVNPYVLYLAGKAEPATGLESKFSVFHGAAVALLDGAADVPQFTDERVADPALVALRRHIQVTGDEAVRTDEAWLRAQCTDGRSIEHHVAHASGTIDNPMSDTELAAKLERAAATRLPSARVRRLLAAVSSLDGDSSLSGLLRLCA